jgi:hypothetical protein
MSSKEKKVTKKDLQEKLKALGVKRVTGFNKAKLEEMLKAENPASQFNVERKKHEQNVKTNDEFIKKAYRTMNKAEPVVRRRDIPKGLVTTNRLVGLANTQFFTKAYKTLGKTEPKWKKQTEDTELFLQNADIILQRQIADAL